MAGIQNQLQVAGAGGVLAPFGQYAHFQISLTPHSLNISVSNIITLARHRNVTMTAPDQCNRIPLTGWFPRLKSICPLSPLNSRHSALH